MYEKLCGYCLPTVVALVLVASSADAQLTRSKAADLIKNSKELQRKSHQEHICIGDCTLAEGAENWVVRGLAALGNADIPGITTKIGAVVYLTEKGKNISRTWSTINSEGAYSDSTGFTRGPRTWWYVRLVQPEFVVVTGILSSENGKTAQVEYTWKFVPNSLGTEFIKAGHSDIPSLRRTRDKPENGTAMFARYDDGWRILGN